ncbi:MAG TPA: SDR family oxidoreductase [Longimicrobiaceae bacterium]|nr:SDR family oxidoreductase [Longimicrobiaceae bacterium]
MGKLDGRVAIVTGATRGIGQAIAEIFAVEGARVVVAGRSREAGIRVADGIRERGGEALYLEADVRRQDDNKRLVDTALKEFGGLDVLAANAGILALGSITEVSMDSWRDALDTNLNSLFFLLREGIPHLRERGGSVVVTGSIAAHKGFPHHAAYCASKGAVQSLVKQAAVDYGPRIRINLIQPGPVDTELYHSSAVAFANPDTILDEVPGSLPMKRVGTAQDVARTALFLAGDESSWITGSVLTVDGGASATG